MLVYSNWQRGLTQIQDVVGSNPAASTKMRGIIRYMTTPDEDREMAATAEKVLSYAGNLSS